MSAFYLLSLQTYVADAAVVARDIKLGSAAAGTTKTNVSGDHVAALDLIADKIVERHLSTCPCVSGFASEEREAFVRFSPTAHPNDGGYIVVFDPLDGSQNLPVGITVGAIFGVFRGASMADIKDGRDMLAAGTCTTYNLALSLLVLPVTFITVFTVIIVMVRIRLILTFLRTHDRKATLFSPQLSSLSGPHFRLDYLRTSAAKPVLTLSTKTASDYENLDLVLVLSNMISGVRVGEM